MLLSAVYLSFLTVTHSSLRSDPKFVSYIEQIGPVYGVTYNQELLSGLGVPGYGTHPYNVLKFGFWTSALDSSMVWTAAFCWEHLATYITEPTLCQELTGKTEPSSAELRVAIKQIYSRHGIQLFITAGNGDHSTADRPQFHGRSATDIAAKLSVYTTQYLYDGVDISWAEPQYFNANGNGETWLVSLTFALHNAFSTAEDTQYYITHSPQANFFMGSTLSKYPRGAYLTVHSNVGHCIDWYNIQFYSQGDSIYNSYETLFEQSIGWSLNSSVYQMSRGFNAEGVSIPTEKIIVGKPAPSYGYDIDYVDGAELKGIFNQAIADGLWNSGFMIVQFFTENTQSPQFPIGNEVVNAQWIPTDAPTANPTHNPTIHTLIPTMNPTTNPTRIPTRIPTMLPTVNSTVNEELEMEEIAQETQRLTVGAFMVVTASVLVLILLCSISWLVYWCVRTTAKDAESDEYGTEEDAESGMYGTESKEEIVEYAPVNEPETTAIIIR